MAGEAAFDPDKPQTSRYDGVERVQATRNDSSTVVRRIRTLIEEGEMASQVAILTRTGETAVKLHQDLQRAEVGSRLIGESQRFYTRLEIRDMANALAAVSDPNDQLSFLALLRSPLVGLSLDSVFQIALDGVCEGDWALWQPVVEADRPLWQQFVAWFVPLRAYADRLPAWEVVSELFRVSGCLSHLATLPECDRILANVRKLLRLAAAVPELGPKEFASQIREIQTLKHAEGDAPIADEDAEEVRVMTIHKAKGLEFPIVFLVGLDFFHAERLPLCVDSIGGRFAFGPHLKKSPAWEHAAHLVTMHAEEEELRVLYVALTRAKTKLFLCHDWGKAGGGFSMGHWLSAQTPTKQLPLWPRPDR